MEGAALREGRERVKTHLIDPLVQKGMQRKQGWTVDQEIEFLDRLQNYLAYMTADNLQGLAETVERYAAGKHKDRWPKEVSITNWARRLQSPPIRMSRLVRSYIQSGAGRAANERGYLAELFDYLKRVGAPPNTFAMGEIIALAEKNRERRAKVKAGRGTIEDEQWFHSYMNRRRICQQLLNSKADEAAA